jgi:hypothetical protein
MPRLSVKIMAHEKRAHLVPDLVERLGLTDDDVIWDRRNDRWDTGRRAWEAIDQTAEWGMVVQDDALPCADLITGMEKALERVPDNVLVTPYIGTRRPARGKIDRVVQEAAAAKAAFIEMPSLNWGVAITAPTRIIDGMLPWCDVQQYPNYDRRIGRYAIDVMRMNTWCTFPSLVDHRDIPSLIGHGDGRVAHHFIGAETSALSVDWDAGSVRMSASRTVARYTGSSSAPVGPYGSRGYHVARKLRVPRQGRNGDVVPERPEGSG